MINEQDMKTIGKGAIQSPEDYRYVNVEHLAGAAPALDSFPDEFHIDFSKVPDLYQRKIGECTNCATAEIVEHRNVRIAGAAKNISPRFTYALCKMEDGIVDQSEQGTYPNASLKIGVKYGFATTSTVDHDTNLDFDTFIFNRKISNIPQAAFTEADQNRIPGYAQVGKFNNVTEAQIKQALMTYPDGIKACLKIGAEWWTAADGTVTWDKAKILPIRKCVTPESGHDIVIVGWKKEQGTGRCGILFRNHWSTDWADADTGWFYLDEHPITEAWAVAEVPDPLLAIIKNLPNQKDFSHEWKSDMAPGQSGVDIEALQIALKIVGSFPFNQPVTQYFGNITKMAVMQFQSSHGVAGPAEIMTAAGKVGPKTREQLNKIFSHK